MQFRDYRKDIARFRSLFVCAAASQVPFYPQIYSTGPETSRFVSLVRNSISVPSLGSRDELPPSALIPSQSNPNPHKWTQHSTTSDTATPAPITAIHVLGLIRRSGSTTRLTGVYSRTRPSYEVIYVSESSDWISRRAESSLTHPIVAQLIKKLCGRINKLEML